MEKDVKLPGSSLDPATAAEAMLGGAADPQSVTRDWQPLQELIAGVEVKEVKNVLKDRLHHRDLA